MAASSRAAHTPGKVDTDWLYEDLLGEWAELRKSARERASNPKLWRIDDLPMADHRARVLEQLQWMADEGSVRIAFPERFGGENNAGGNLAQFQELVLADPSLQIKSGVQYGLFAAAVLHLGTKKHHDALLPDILSLKIPGAFAMTETGHGSDVSSIATTATYDPETETFDLNTPFRGAFKDYLGNAALHGQAATVFAQLITNGVNHGVHAFYVPIRTPEGELLDGIHAEDDGVKGGLNGIDNGRLQFTHVKVPREMLLNRYGDVAADGTYTSDIESPGRRFFTMLGTLVQGRVSLDGSAVVASKAALTIAVRYGAERRQFTASRDDREEVILDYRRHQQRLLPRLAETYAMSYAHEKLLRVFHEVFTGEQDTPEHREHLETLAAGLKSLSTWHALDTLQECREACGGAGFLTVNRFTSLREDLDIYVTFEGDNNVLLQLVGKRLLTDYGAKFKDASPAQVVQWIAGQAADRAVAGAGLRVVAQDVQDLGRVDTASRALRRTATQRELLSHRVDQMVADIAGRMHKARGLDQAQAAEVFNDNQNELIEAATAWVELQQWEAFTEALTRMPDATRRVVRMLRDLFGLSLIERHAAWHLANGRLSGSRYRALRATRERLLVKLRPHALDLVDAFGFTDALLRAEIATGAEAARQAEANAYFDALRDRGELPVTEKELRAAAKAKGPEGAQPVPPAEIVEISEDINLAAPGADGAESANSGAEDDDEVALEAADLEDEAAAAAPARTPRPKVRIPRAMS